MSDLQLLFLVLTVLYGWECASWLRRGSVACTTWLGRRWRVKHPGALLGNPRGGFVFAAPLPPLGTLFTANQFPLSLSPEAALAFVSTNVNPGWRPAQSGRALSFEDLQEVRANGKKLRVNGKVWLVASSTTHARSLAGVILQLANLKPGQREEAIRNLAAASLDSKEVAKRCQEFDAQSRPLRWWANALVAYVFVVAPIMIWFVGLRLSWLGLLVGLCVLTGATATRFRRAHRVLYPDAGDERFAHTLTIALSPANAMRARDALSRPLLEQFHPLAVASVFLPRTDFQVFARRTLLDLRHPALPVCPGTDGVAHAAEAFWRHAVRVAAEEMLKRGGMDPDDLCRPPAPADDACCAYCLRCDAQFTSTASHCADCGGLAVEALVARG